MSNDVGRFAARTISWALLAVVVVAGLALIVVPKATGAKLVSLRRSRCRRPPRPLTVLSGSMVPTYDPGDVVIVRDADTRDLEVGQVITFQPTSDDPRLTTHRVVQVTYGFCTARATSRRATPTTLLIPTPCARPRSRARCGYSVPLVGYLSVWMATGPLGQLVNLFAFGLIAYAVVQIGRGLRQHPGASQDTKEPQVSHPTCGSCRSRSCCS